MCNTDNFLANINERFLSKIGLSGDKVFFFFFFGYARPRWRLLYQNIGTYDTEASQFQRLPTSLRQCVVKEEKEKRRHLPWVLHNKFLLTLYLEFWKIFSTICLETNLKSRVSYFTYSHICMCLYWSTLFIVQCACIFWHCVNSMLFVVVSY